MLQSLLSYFSGSYVALAIAIVVALALLVIVLMVLYRMFFGAGVRVRGAARGRQPRLGVVDAYDLDRERQLVIVRRDNTEHLIMIGKHTDLVIETDIIRSQSLTREKVEKTDPSIPLPPRMPVSAQPLVTEEPAPLPPQPIAPPFKTLDPAPAAPSPVPPLPAFVAQRNQDLSAVSAPPVPPPALQARIAEPIFDEAKSEPVKVEPPKVDAPKPKVDQPEVELLREAPKIEVPKPAPEVVAQPSPARPAPAPAKPVVPGIAPLPPLRPLQPLRSPTLPPLPSGSGSTPPIFAPRNAANPRPLTTPIASVGGAPASGVKAPLVIASQQKPAPLSEPPAPPIPPPVKAPPLPPDPTSDELIDSLEEEMARLLGRSKND